MLPWLLAALTLVAVALSTPAMGRHLFAVFDGRPQPLWDRWLNPIEAKLLGWMGASGREAQSLADYLLPLLMANLGFGLVAFGLLLVEQL